MTTISAPGHVVPASEADDVDLGLLERADVEVRRLGDIQIDASRMSGTTASVDGAEPTSIVEIVLEGDLRWITTVDRLADAYPERADRGALSEGDFRLPTHLGPGIARGGAGDGLKVAGARIFDLDLDDFIKEITGDPAARAGNVAGDLLGPKIARWFDERQVKKPGVYRLAVKNGKATLDLVKARPAPADQPFLVFLHGTASTTEGSFSGLWAEHPKLWQRLSAVYGDRILTLEHRTLAESPIDNALLLARILPKGARLHLVSHSRGGMIGELLCRSNRIGGGVFDDIDTAFLAEPGYELQQERLLELGDLLTTRQMTVERFVRVAAPAAGTTLADGKLDRWLSTLMSVVGKLGADMSAIYRFIRGFTLAVVETRTEPEHIPGLEAMMPGSPLTRILNRPDVASSADLSVIAGDIEGKGLFHRLGVWLTDLYYQGDHDLVVDTASMYGGGRRGAGRARRYFEDGPDVYHFRYFKNASTAEKVMQGLARPDDDPLGTFEALPEPPALKDLRARSGEVLPTVFLLPGILGSHLGYGDNRIWLDVKDVFRGRIERLDLHRKKPKDIQPDGVFHRFYAELANYLAASHDVVPFDYDWRISMQAEAARFGRALGDRLTSSARPVRIIAHSMGGLIARLAFALDPDLWQRFRDKEGCRLVMLGTPNRGSFSIPRMLMGKERTTKLLAVLDIKNDEKDLLRIISRFPGILELLPIDERQDFFGGAIWDALQRADPKGWHRPVEVDLATARATWDLLETAPVDGARMTYVAGQAPATPIALKIVDGREVRFEATAQGDGRVPWATGMLPGLGTYYVPAAHGDLPRHTVAFRGYLDLLEQGATRLLSTTRPIARGATVPFDLPDDALPIYPDEGALEAAAIGAMSDRALASTRRIRISVRFGDLAYANHPVMVGHYEQDSINGGEWKLDQVLGGRLSTRHARNLYPGRIDTAEVIVDGNAHPPGAVVIGLGEVGSVTSGRLKRAFSRGLRHYCLVRSEDMKRGDAASPAFGLSTLVIGSGEGGMDVRDSLAALLDTLVELERDEALEGLEHVEIIEHFEHRAIGVMRELDRLRHQQRYADDLVIDTELTEGAGGRRRLVLETDRGWAQRIEVEKLETAEDQPIGLRFAAITGRARIEGSVVADTLKLADAFIGAAVGQASHGGHDSPSRSLFELLVPLRLKIASEDDRDLILMLDDFSARYPWELMEDKPSRETPPPAVRAGMIRQLRDEQFRTDVFTTHEHTALVVGDPDPVTPSRKFPPLDGAVEEARAIADLLSAKGYAVEEQIRTRPSSVVSGLMGRGYKILHLAAHGVFEQDIDGQIETGMVLGDGLFLTAGAINQLRYVPDLVFLNCCHLGKIDEAAESAATTRYHELAANLATQFIKIGAKAVIAAGWAVDDAAARTFATTFYRAMLDDGERFMRAVQTARTQVYTSYPYTNSWGAYQAYGDQAFTLGGVAGRGRGNGPRWYTPYEAVLEFEELAQRAQTMKGVDPAALEAELDALRSHLPDAWQERADVLTSRAKAAGELGILPDAIDAYERGFRAEKAEATMRAIEQRANLSARFALSLAKGRARPVDALQGAPIALIEGAIDTLDMLVRRYGDSLERLNLLGSAAKRASQLDDEGQAITQIEWLKTMASRYHAAHLKAPTRAYALTNWLMAAALVRLRDGEVPEDYAPPSLDGQEDLLEKTARAEAAADSDVPDFWALAARGDIDLTRLLARAVEELDEKTESFDAFAEKEGRAVAEAYLKAWNRGGSVLKMNSVMEQLDFVVDALSKGRPATAAERKTLVRVMHDIEERLQEAMKPSD